MGNFRIQFNYNSYDGEIYGQQELTNLDLINNITYQMSYMVHCLNQGYT